MDPRLPAADPLTDDAAEFVRFCYRRRPVGWPDLYDEMCAVSNRGQFRGWGPDELARNGIGFGLFELPALASLVHRVVAEEQETRRATPDRGRRRSRGSTVEAAGGEVDDPGLRIAVVVS
jgi:hypothetical protein